MTKTKKKLSLTRLTMTSLGEVHGGIVVVTQPISFDGSSCGSGPRPWTLFTFCPTQQGNCTVP
jgi:hypothetical protein